MMPKREWVGKRIRLNADAVRQKSVAVIECVGSEDLAGLKTNRKELEEHVRTLETALKEWESVGTVEDSFEALKWREDTREACREFLKETSRQVDLAFPEQALSRKLGIKRSVPSWITKTSFDIGPETKETLVLTTSLENERLTLPRATGSSNSSSSSANQTSNANKSTGENAFVWNVDSTTRTLTCTWTLLMTVRVRFLANGEVEYIRIVQDGEKSWPSEFDLIRELERQARRAMRDFSLSSEVVSHDHLTSRLIQWLGQRRDLFTRRCSFTHRFVAFGAVGESGKLEARPPMLRDEGTHEASFHTDLF